MTLDESGSAPTALADDRPVARPRGEGAGDLLFGALLTGILIVLGALLGLLWAWWSPPRFAAVLYPDGEVLPDTESHGGTRMESWIAGDGRFLVIGLVVGVLAGVTVWLLRPARRGAVAVGALAVGSVAAALVMDGVGYLVGGGDGDGAYRVTLTDGSVHPYTKELPLQVHTTGLLFVQAAAAVLVYALFVAFTSNDDLGRPDSVRARLLAARAQPRRSVDAGDQPQGGWADRDAPRAPQQGDLPPQ